MWQNLCGAKGPDKGKLIPPLPSRLLTEDDLKSFYEVMKISSDAPVARLPDTGLKRKSGYLGGLDTQQYGRGKRAREVCLNDLYIIFLNISSSAHAVSIHFYGDYAMYIISPECICSSLMLWFFASVGALV